MRPRRLILDAALCAGAAVFYLANRLWLSPGSSGVLHLFLTCWANDLFAGLAIVAWLDLLLVWAKLSRVRFWGQTVPFLLLCALVWEGLSPMWKPGAVFDPFDFLAYQAGGVIYLLLTRGMEQKWR